MNGVTQKSSSRVPDWLIVTILLVVGLKFTFGLENIVDISLYDESNYLYWGVNIANAGFPSAEVGPLYSLWYFILSIFQPDRVNLYYLNLRILTILPSILVYILLRNKKALFPLSLIISLFLLISCANLYCWPKVSHFALIIALITLIGISHTDSPLWISVLVSFGALLVSFIRPEYFLAYLLSLLLFAVTFVLQYRKLSGIHLTGLIAYALISVLLLVMLGLPVSGNRSIFAFGQHFSLHWVTWTGSQLNPWTNFEEIVSKNFGSAHTISEAFRNNPSVFLKHIAYNLKDCITNSTALFFPAIFPMDTLSKAMATLSIIGLSIACISNVRKNVLEYGRFLIIIGLFLVPGLVSVVIIYPRYHYLLLPFVLTVVVMALVVSSRTPEQAHVNSKQLVLLGLLLIALTPYFPGQVGTNHPNLDTIRFIQSLRITEPVNMLEAEGGFHIYLGDTFHRVAEYDKNESFDLFLAHRNINMIVVTDRLLKDNRFRDDSEWKSFLLNYPILGYLQIDIPNTERKLLIRRNLLRRFFQPTSFFKNQRGSVPLDT